MKWLVLAFMPVAVLVLAGAIRRFPTIVLPVVWALMGVFLFTPNVPHFGFALFPWPDWPGYSRGIELSFIDLLSLAIYLCLPRSRSKLPFRYVTAFYLFTVALSALQADEPVAVLFYVWQILRMIFFFYITMRCVDDPRFVPSIFIGMTLGLGFEASLVVYQKYVQHMVQPSGGFNHQNLLGMVSYMIAVPMLALLLSGYRSLVATVAIGCCSAIVALVASRGGLAFSAVGFALVVALSLCRSLTTRKATFILIGLVGAGVLAQLSFAALQNRFAQAAVTTTYDERAALELAASLAVADHPMGIGANNFAYSAVSQGYMKRAKVSDVTLTTISPHVHNAYWLVTAETGYVGLIAFLLMLIRPLVVAIRCGWKAKGDRRGDYLLGAGVALLMIYIHSTLEWVGFMFVLQYVVAFTFGMIAGLAQQLSYFEKTRPVTKASPALAPS